MEKETVEIDEDTFYMRENEMEEVEELSSELCESSLSIRPETEVESEKEQQAVFRLQHVDTETLIKSEMKQLVLAKVAEATSLKALNDLIYQVEEQMTRLKNKQDQLLNKNEDLQREIEMDSNRLEQSETILLNFKEMIELLKQKVLKLENKFKESHIEEILEKSQKQFCNIENLNSAYATKITNNKKKIKDMLASKELNMHLKLELEHREKMLDDFKKKYEEMKEITSSYGPKIEITRKKNQFLEQKLADIKNEKCINYDIVENDITTQNKQIEKLKLKKKNRIEKLNQLSEQKLALEKQLEECIRDTDTIKRDVSNTKEETEQTKIQLKEIKKQLEIKNSHYEEKAQQLKQNYDFICYQLNEIKENMSVVSESNNRLQNELDALKVNYDKNCEEKLEWTNKILQQQTAVHSFQLDLVEKKMENTIKRTKLEELQSNHEASVRTLKSLDDGILKEKENRSKDLEEAKTKHELLKTEHDQYLTELNKKKEYSLATSNYLTEKSQSFKTQIEEMEKVCKNSQDENQSLRKLIEEKQNLFNKAKQKLEMLKKKGGDVPLKSGLKTPERQNPIKKVQFNEFISFKSATESSETSSQPVAQVRATLESSLNDWFQDLSDTELLSNKHTSKQSEDKK